MTLVLVAIEVPEVLPRPNMELVGAGVAEEATEVPKRAPLVVVPVGAFVGLLVVFDPKRLLVAAGAAVVPDIPNKPVLADGCVVDDVVPDAKRLEPVLWDGVIPVVEFPNNPEPLA